MNDQRQQPRSPYDTNDLNVAAEHIEKSQGGIFDWLCTGSLSTPEAQPVWFDLEPKGEVVIGGGMLLPAVQKVR